MPICRGCGSVIRWVEMKSGKKMPLDEKAIQAVQVKAGIGEVIEVFIPHWATCKKSNDFKRREK